MLRPSNFEGENRIVLMHLNQDIRAAIAGKLDVSSRNAFALSCHANFDVVASKIFWQNQIRCYLPYLENEELNRYQNEPAALFNEEFTRRKSLTMATTDDEYYAILAAGMGDYSSVADKQAWTRQEAFLSAAHNGSWPVLEQMSGLWSNDTTVYIKGRALIKAAMHGHRFLVEKIDVQWGSTLIPRDKRTALSCAAANGHISLIQRMNELWGDKIGVLAKREAFSVAVYSGQLSLLEPLAALWSDVIGPDYIRVALFQIAQDGELAVLKKIIKRWDHDDIIALEDKIQALEWAVRGQQLPQLKLLFMKWENVFSVELKEWALRYSISMHHWCSVEKMYELVGDDIRTTFKCFVLLSLARNSEWSLFAKLSQLFFTGMVGRGLLTGVAASIGLGFGTLLSAATGVLGAGFTSLALNKRTQYMKESYQSAHADLNAFLGEDIDVAHLRAQAFEFGVLASQSRGGYFNAYVNTSTYTQYDAYFAGTRAEFLHDEELIDDVKSRINQRA